MSCERHSNGITVKPCWSLKHTLIVHHTLIVLPAVCVYLSPPGALVGSRFAVLFKWDATLSAAPVTSVSFSLPAGAPTPARVFVTGLVPGAAYQISNPGGPGTYLVAQGGTTLADASGAVLF